MRKLAEMQAFRDVRSVSYSTRHRHHVNYLRMLVIPICGGLVPARAAAMTKSMPAMEGASRAKTQTENPVA